MIRRPVHEVVVQLSARRQNESIVDERAADVLLHLCRVEGDLLLHPDGLIGGNRDRTDCRAFAVVFAGCACGLPGRAGGADIPRGLRFDERDFQPVHIDRAVVIGQVLRGPQRESGGFRSLSEHNRLTIRPNLNWSFKTRIRRRNNCLRKFFICQSQCVF